MPIASSGAVRGGLLDRVDDARRRSDELFGIVRPDALYERPIPERHRIIFYVGHLEAFDWNLLHGVLPDLKAFDPELDRLFAFGIDPVNGSLPADQPSDWPRLGAIQDYVSKIRAALDEKLEDEGSFGRAPDGFSLETLLNVAIEHRLMHVETLAYMLHQLPWHQKVPHKAPADRIFPPSTPSMINVPSGVAKLGLPRASSVFGWDNEFEAHEVEVPAFEIDRYKVTNREYLEFLNSGGYDGRELWRLEDWHWKTNEHISHPAFWKKAGENWLFRGMFEEIPLPLDWPVFVSHAEASAFANWAGKCLPTEKEWQRAAYGTMEGKERQYPWGFNPPEGGLGNFDFERWNPAPVNAFPRGESAFGVQDMLGNGWEWTSSEFAPFPGFKAFSFYKGYSADFFDGKHFVLKGASPRTAVCMLRPSFRNWFQPHYQYVYAGFRCVKR
ncbi:MAG TPA: SUMF1/EgtB/PvdO family nonheme iron enzyme [Terriglobales bacterium]|nr:SUMF1/EgtB/PvdO family nonheme iron enzyme [Terriglobales bacterium]